MFKTQMMIALAGMLMMTSVAFAQDTFKAENVPPVVQHLGRHSGMFPHVDEFMRRGPMTTWAARGPDNPWEDPERR